MANIPDLNEEVTLAIFLWCDVFTILKLEQVGDE